MGHASDIISIDVYGDNKQIVEDCLKELEPFIESVKPKKTDIIVNTDVCIDENLINELVKQDWDE